MLFLRFQAAFGAMLRTGCRGGGFAAPRSGAGAVVVGGRTGGPALRFPARGFSLYRSPNVKNQVRAFFAIRRRMEMYGYRPESLRSLVRKLLG